jgi:hypothetical protein
MADVLWYLLVVALLGGAVVVGALFVRGNLPGVSLLTRFFPRNPERRLDVVEQANIDGRRRLVLIRRDDVEHLVMTGGPVDVVIETGIGVERSDETRQAPATFTRQPPPLSKVSGDR